MPSLSTLPPRQTFVSAAGHEYSYISIPPSSSTKFTLLFLHGFPSHIPDWINQISHFRRLGYGILVPDLLGYGQSSQPDDVGAYSVVGIGHDFGATLLSRIVAYHHHRFSRIIFLAVGPPAFETPFNVAQINEITRKLRGFEALGYISWIAEDATSQRVLEKNAESAMSLIFCREKEEWARWFYPLGKMKSFVEAGEKVGVGEWFGEELQRAHMVAFRRKDGYMGVRGWYRMWIQELFVGDEKGFKDVNIEQPVLFIVPKDPLQAAKQQEGFLKAWCTNLKTVGVEGGRWVQLEKAQETNKAIEEFLA